MAGFFKTIIGILLYKEPVNSENGFELLESEGEGGGRNRQEAGGQQCGQEKGDVPKEKSKPVKTPLKIEDWNESKNEKSDQTCQMPKNPEDVAFELDKNLAVIRQKFGMPQNQDIIVRQFRIGRKIKAFMAYIEGMVDKNTLNFSIYPRLMSKEISDEMDQACPADYLLENILAVYRVDKSRKFTDIVLQLLSGASALFIEGCNECILLDTRGFEKRNIEQPVTETVVKGSQEGFTESLRTNLTMVRRIIKNEKLVTELLPVGKMNNSNCAILYLKDIVNTKVVEEVKKRIRKIDTDFIMGGGMIEQFIEDNPFMLFPQVLSTERPDRAASFLMEGQVVVIAEGTPFALTAPVTFFRLFHTSEDSFARWPFGTFLRLIRIIGLFCATLLPGLYTAIALFHPEALPTELLSSIAASKESVPFPTLLEVLMLEIAFELIREGGVRVPGVIGQTLGIVGALILGQAAVAAGLVSPMLVIIVSVTALGNFAIPNYSMALAIRIERFFFILAGGIVGIYGISLVLFLLAVTACSMKSFGVPFFAPVAPRARINPDVIARYPIWMQKFRPDALNTPNRKKQGRNVNNWSKEENQSNKGKRGSS